MAAVVARGPGAGERVRIRTRAVVPHLAVVDHRDVVVAIVTGRQGRHGRNRIALHRDVRRTVVEGRCNGVLHRDDLRACGSVSAIVGGGPSACQGVGIRAGAIGPHFPIVRHGNAGIAIVRRRHSRRRWHRVAFHRYVWRTVVKGWRIGVLNGDNLRAGRIIAAVISRGPGAGQSVRIRTRTVGSHFAVVDHHNTGVAGVRRRQGGHGRNRVALHRRICRAVGERRICMINRNGTQV